MSDPSLLADITAEAERIRRDGTLPPGYEGELRAAFDEIAADPAALEQEAAALRAALVAPGPPPSRAGRLLGGAARLARRRAGALRHRVGPPLRSLERRAVERAADLGARLGTHTQLLAERGRALPAGSPRAARLWRAVTGESGTGEELTTPVSLRISPAGRLGDDALNGFLTARLAEGAPGPLLNVESGDGSLVRRLAGEGREATGCDPRHGEGACRKSALAAVAALAPGSTAAIVLAGGAGRLSGPAARAMARLVADRLAPGGVVVVLSETPGWRAANDPVAADLSGSHPLHAVTWRYLFARAGLGRISSCDSGDGSAFAVAAVRPV